MIEHSKTCLGPREAAAAARVIRSGLVACGRETALLEREAARWAKMRYAVATTSGTSALLLALRAFGIGPDDEVIIPTFCCSAPWHACMQAGATPVLADCDLETLNPSPEDVARRLTRRTKAVILPNLFGLPCDPAAYALPKRVRVLQDCAHAAGARLNGRFVGASGDACVLSFYATKLLTCGEGGMLLCDCRDWAEAALDLRACDRKASDRVRYNAKMTDIQAAIARVQLQRLGSFLKHRAALAGTYNRLLSSAAMVLPPRRPGRVYYRYVVRLPMPAGPAIARLNRLGVQAREPIFRPLHLDVPCRGRFPQAEQAHSRCLSLPIHPLVSHADAERTAAALNAIALSRPAHV